MAPQASFAHYQAFSRLRLAIVPIVAQLLVLSPVVQSQSLAGVTGKASVGLGNVFRGYQHGHSGLSPSIYVQKSWTSGFYAGIWAGRFDWAPDTYRDREINYVVGVSRRISTKLVVETAFTHYSYPGAAGARDYDWHEWLTRLQVNDQSVVTYGLGKNWLAAGEYSHFVKFTQVYPLPYLMELDISLASVFLEGSYLNNYQYVEAGIEKVLGQWNVRVQVSLTDNVVEEFLGPTTAGTQYALTASFLF